MGQMAPIMRGLQGPGNPARGGQSPADTISSRAIHCPHGGGGFGGPPELPAPRSNYHFLAGHCPDHLSDGNLGPGPTGLGLPLRGSPSHDGGWRRGWEEGFRLLAAYGGSSKIQGQSP